MRARIFYLAFLLVIGFVIPTNKALATTIYVDVNSSAIAQDGAIATPWKTIQSALTAAAEGDTIRVAPGEYLENINITKKNILLMGTNPRSTFIQKAGDIITINATDVSVSGFNINSGTRGIFVNNNMSSNIHNNILFGNSQGIATGTNSNNVIVNNVIARNNDALYLGGYNSIKNNIISNSTRYYLNTMTGSNSSLIYNLIANNTLATNCVGTCTYSTSINNISNTIDPLFNTDNSYSLQSGSPAINAGSPNISDNDPDGSRNDMGAYGGPGAAEFWPGTAGGPIVTELVVSPPSVPQGGKISIKATAKSQ